MTDKKIQRWRLHVNLNGKVPNAQTTIFHIKDDDGAWVKFEDIKIYYILKEKIMDVINRLKASTRPDAIYDFQRAYDQGIEKAIEIIKSSFK